MSNTHDKILDDIKRATDVTREKAGSIDKKLDEILAVLREIAASLDSK